MTNEELLKENLEKLLVWLNESSQQGVEFVVQQAPLVVQEIILQARICNTIYLLSSFIITLLLVLLVELVARLIWKGSKEEDRDLLVYYGFKCTIQSIISIMGLVAISSWMYGFVQAWFAPRLYVINYVLDLIN